MAKVKIQGHASGTGVLTVTAPNTSTDRTITLPDATGTLLNSDGDGSNLTGISSVGGATGVDFNDNVKARFGTGNDLEIYHDASDSIIADTGTGALEIRSNELKIKNAAGNENAVYFAEDGAVTLYHNNVAKFLTTADGIQINGNIEIGTHPFAITGESGSDRLTIQENTGNVWIDGNCSAASFTDRTPYPNTLQLAYDVINSHKKLPDGQYKTDDHSKQLDHSQLHEYVKEEDNNRNMSGVISCLVEVIKDLSTKNTALEARITALENA